MAFRIPLPEIISAVTTVTIRFVDVSSINGDFSCGDHVPPATSAPDSVTHSEYRLYAGMTAGGVCRDDVVQRVDEEAIQPL